MYKLILFFLLSFSMMVTDHCVERNLYSFLTEEEERVSNRIRDIAKTKPKPINLLRGSLRQSIREPLLNLKRRDGVFVSCGGCTPISRFKGNR